MALGLLLSCNAEQPVNTIDKTEKSFNNGNPEIVTQYIKKGDELIPYGRIQYHNNGEVYFEGKLNENGERNGLWISFYPSGKKWSEGEFTDGKADGKRVVWFENGQKRYEGQFTQGNKTGVWKFWDENGGILEEINYDN